MEKQLRIGFMVIFIFTVELNAQFLTKVDSLCVDEVFFSDSPTQRHIYSHLNGNYTYLLETSYSFPNANALCRFTIINNNELNINLQQNRHQLSGDGSNATLDNYRKTKSSAFSIYDEQCIFDQYSKILYNGNQIVGAENLIEKYCGDSLFKRIIIDSSFGSSLNFLFDNNDFFHSFISNGNSIFQKVLNLNDEIIIQDSLNIAPYFCQDIQKFEMQNEKYLVVYGSYSPFINVFLKKCYIIKITSENEMLLVKDFEMESTQENLAFHIEVTDNNYVLINLNSTIQVLDPEFNQVQVFSSNNTSLAYLFKYNNEIYTLMRDRVSSDRQDFRIFKFNNVTNSFELFKMFHHQDDLNSYRFTRIRLVSIADNFLVIAGSFYANNENEVNILILDQNLDKLAIEKLSFFGNTKNIVLENFFSNEAADKLYMLIDAPAILGSGEFNKMWYYQLQFNDATHIPTFPNPTFSLSPNPTSNQIHVQYTRQDFRQYFISDLQGRKIKSGNIDPQSAQSDIDVQELSQGIYLLSLQGKKGAAVKKFVKQ